MSNSLFFPHLIRQPEDCYKGTHGDFYATYNCNENYINVSVDCKNRCVYCDAMVDECGGERFSLDHFRPVNIFGEKFNGILKIHPFNLHLSCQKCNVLKTKDWQGCKDSIDGPTHISGKGYIDRFRDHISNFLEVDSDGFVKSIDSSGPGNYIIGRLLLNRTNRVYLRRMRAMRAQAEIVHSKLIEKQREIIENWNNGTLTVSDALRQIGHITSLLERFTKLGLLRR